VKKFPSVRCVFDKPSECSFQLTADHVGPRPTVVIRPGTQLYANGLSFCFSGFIINDRIGITVAHGVDPGDTVSLDPKGKHVIGQCCKSFGRLRHSSGLKITADLAVLKFEFGPNACIENTVKYKNGNNERSLNIRIHRGTVPPLKRTEIMIQDRNRDFRFGYVSTVATNKCRLSVDGCICPQQVSTCRCVIYNQGYHHVLGISPDPGERNPMIEEGDSGALVMSRPDSDDCVDVYGIVIGILRSSEGDFTIASQLHNVITQIMKNERKYTDAGSDDIDFI